MGGVRAGAGRARRGRAVAFASGTAAAAAILETLPGGARVVGPERGYAWTRSLLAERAATGRIALQTVDTVTPRRPWPACEGADLLWLESPSNPLLEVAELDRLCGAGLPVAVDSTFATPLLQRPLELGAAFSLHSATKFIGGHSDLLPAWSARATTRDWERCGMRGRRSARRRGRSRPSSHCAGCARCRCGWSSRSALRSRWRSGCQRIRRSARSTTPASGRCSPSRSAPTRWRSARRARVITYAKSLGGVESLIDRRGPSLLRLSVGCEHVEDLWADLDVGLVVAEDRAQRAADLTDGGGVLERLADRRQQVVGALGGLFELGQPAGR